MAIYSAHQGEGDNHELWFFFGDTSKWNADTPVRNFGATTSPSFAVFGRGLYCATNVNGSVAVDAYTGGKPPWVGAIQVPGALAVESPGLVTFDEELYCFYQAMSANDQATGQLCYSTYNSVTNRWSAPTTAFAKAVMSDSPAALQFNGLLYCFFQGPKHDGKLWFTSSPSGATDTWTQPVQATPTPTDGEPIRMTFAPSPVLVGSTLYVFMQGEGGSRTLWYTTTTDGSSWTPNQQVVPPEGQGAVGMSESPAAMAVGSGIIVFHQGTDQGNDDGNMWYTTYDGSAWTKDTQISSVRMSGSPTVAAF